MRFVMTSYAMLFVLCLFLFFSCWALTFDWWQNFDYTEYPGLIGEPAIEHPSSEQQHHNSAHGGSDEGSRTPTSGGEHSKSSMSPGSAHLNSSRSRSWPDCNRQSEVDKIQIPKV
jgi:hypothetical protein